MRDLLPRREEPLAQAMPVVTAIAPSRAPSSSAVHCQLHHDLGYWRNEHLLA